jgi:23S rRNA pseudouridine2605 synthase
MTTLKIQTETGMRNMRKNLLETEAERGTETEVRLNKALADAGLCSRRRADEWITAGFVQVNGRTVNKPGLRLRPSDTLVVRGKEIRLGSPVFIYLMLNKPVRVVSTLHDPQKRETICDFLPPEYAGKRVFPAGRLDFFSEGLLLLTNDGELARRLTHPSFHLPKYYELWIRGEAGTDALESMRSGMTLAEGEKLAPAAVRRLGRHTRGERLHLTLRQGVNRQIRRMCRDLNITVLRLLRIGQGPIVLGDLPPGRCRVLTGAELSDLRAAVGLDLIQQGEQQGDKQRHQQTQAQTIEHGHYAKALVGAMDNHRQAGIHARSSGGGHWSQRAKKTDQQGRAQQAEQFATQVGEHGNGPQGQIAVIADDRSGQTVIAEPSSSHQGLTQFNAGQQNKSQHRPNGRAGRSQQWNQRGAQAQIAHDQKTGRVKTHAHTYTKKHEPDDTCKKRLAIEYERQHIQCAEQHAQTEKK